MPDAGQLYRYALGLAGLRRRDIVVASFPKSGSTWVRFVIANLAAVREGDDRPIDFPTLDARMPEFGRDNLLRHLAVGGLPRFVKTHNPYWAAFAGKRVVLVTRDPRDTMVSFFQFEQGKHTPRHSGPFADFIRDDRVGLPAWFAHTRSWRAQRPIEIRYEDLKADDVGVARALFERLGLAVSPEEVREAVTRSRFERVQKLEAAEGMRDPTLVKDDFKFTRSGKVGRWTEWFSDADLLYYQSLCDAHGFDL